MRPILFRIPIPFSASSIPIYGYGFMLVWTFLSAIWLGRRMAQKQGIDPRHINDFGFVALISGIFGARLTYVLLNLREYDSLWSMLDVRRGGLVFYGGLIAGVGAVVWSARRRDIPIPKVADLCAPAIPLGISFARIGCFLNGCCFGDPAPKWLPWAVRFPRESFAYARHQHKYPQLLDRAPDASLPVHPAQLYAALAALALSIVLLYSLRWLRREGQVFCLLGLLYSVARFLLEAVRDDTDPLVLGLTFSQCVSVVLFAVCAYLMRQAQRSGASRTAGKTRA